MPILCFDFKAGGRPLRLAGDGETGCVGLLPPLEEVLVMDVRRVEEERLEAEAWRARRGVRWGF